MIARLKSENALLLIVDIQEKLLAAMPDATGLIRDACFLTDVANLLQVPIIATEQYPQGLGPTHSEILSRISTSRIAKVAFSCCGSSDVKKIIKENARSSIIVIGMEAHVCILQTVLDLIAMGLNIFLVEDAIQSRFAIDRDIAIRRMEKAGAIPVSVESVTFELLEGADHPAFKSISKMIQSRSKQLKGLN